MLAVCFYGVGRLECKPLGFANPPWGNRVSGALSKYENTGSVIWGHRARKAEKRLLCCCRRYNQKFCKAMRPPAVLFFAYLAA